MPAKSVLISALGASTFRKLSGNTADFMVQADMVDDTIYGHAYKSMQPDILNWELSANAVYKGYAGYQAKIMKTGPGIVFTDEPAALVSGQIYEITDTTKRIIDQATAPVVKAGGVDQTANVEKIDYLFGRIIFKSTYTVSGAVTITGKYLPNAQVCSMNKYSLSQQADAVDSTDLCIAQSNQGFRQYQPGLKTVSLELTGFYKLTSTFLDELKARERFIIELNPDGLGHSTCRGFFIVKSDKQSGKVGSIEEENVSMDLWAPDGDLLQAPFSWVHKPESILNLGVRTLLDAWINEVLVDARYLEDGVSGKQGSAVVTNMSLAGGLGALNEFSVQLKGSGAYTNV
jgi:hypothetical protein